MDRSIDIVSVQGIGLEQLHVYSEREELKYNWTEQTAWNE